MPKFLFLNIISMKYVLHILSHDWVITHCHDPRSICFLTYLASFVKKPIMHITHLNIIPLWIMQILRQESLMISTKIYFLPNTELKMLLLRASLDIFQITRKVCRKSCLNKKRIQKSLSGKFSGNGQQWKKHHSCKRWEMIIPMGN